MKTLNSRMTHECWRLECQFDRRGATPSDMSHAVFGSNKFTRLTLKQLSAASLVIGIGWARCEKWPYNLTDPCVTP